MVKIWSEWNVARLVLPVSALVVLFWTAGLWTDYSSINHIGIRIQEYFHWYTESFVCKVPHLELELELLLRLCQYTGSIDTHRTWLVAVSCNYHCCLF